MDRLRHLSLGVLLALVGCPDGAPPAASPGRFAAVTDAKAESAALTAFCEKTYPAKGAGSLRYAAPPQRPIPGEKPPAAPVRGRWTWVNFWATWCNPCMEEMVLLGRWQGSLARDGAAFNLEVWSVDEDGALLQRALKKPIPGTPRWLRNPDDYTAFLEVLGLPRETPIPIHVLVDPAGMVRCARVGSVHDADYGKLKAILGG